MTDGFTGIIDQLERQRAAIERALAALREIDAPGPGVERAYSTRHKTFAAKPPVRGTEETMGGEEGG